MLPEEITVVNKTGTTSTMVGDMALLYFPDSPPLAMTIKLAEPGDHQLAEQEIGEIARLIVDLLR